MRKSTIFFIFYDWKSRLNKRNGKKYIKGLNDEMGANRIEQDRGPGAVVRTDLRSYHLGNSTSGRLPLGKTFLGSTIHLVLPSQLCAHLNFFSSSSSLMVWLNRSSVHASNCPSILCIFFCTFLYINIIILLYSAKASNSPYK